MTRKVVFLHRQGLVNAGSKIMRCDQLCDIARMHLSDRYDFSVQSQNPIRSEEYMQETLDRLRGATVILLKGTGRLFKEEGLARLRAETRGLCIDYVDSNMAAKFTDKVDLHISASIEGTKILRRLKAEHSAGNPKGEIAYLTHHADPRLDGISALDAQAARIAFIGNPKNTILPKGMSKNVELLHYGKDRQIDTVFPMLKDYPIHYCLRPSDQVVTRQRDTTKPFTKGFVAAAVDANVIAARGADDAVHYLGTDYPYLVDDMSGAGIATMIDKVRHSFGSTEWRAASDRMAYVKSITSPACVAHELGMILSRFD